MKRAWILLLAFVLPCAAVLPARGDWGAEDDDGTYSYTEYPDLALQAQDAMLAYAFPDLEAGAFWRAEYSEYLLPDHRLVGLIVCETQVGGYLAVLHYGADGLSRVRQAGLPLPLGQETTLSFGLPPRTSVGVSRLLLWREPPLEDQLARLAQEPNRLTEPFPGLLGQRWFARGESSKSVPYWEDPLQLLPLAPPRYSLEVWPWCRAVPTVRGVVQAKDCAVQFTGTTRWEFGEHGIFALWELDWASELNLVVVLPESVRARQAELYLWESQSAAPYFSSWPPLDLTVNGWSLGSLGYTSLVREPGEPIVVPVSQYITGGTNQLSLRLSAFADTQLLLSGIELWVY